MLQLLQLLPVRLQAVRLESIHAQVTRYMVVVSTNGRQDTEESVVLGMDFSPLDRWDSDSCFIQFFLQQRCLREFNLFLYSTAPALLGWFCPCGATP